MIAFKKALLIVVKDVFFFPYKTPNMSSSSCITRKDHSPCLYMKELGFKVHYMFRTTQ